MQQKKQSLTNATQNSGVSGQVLLFTDSKIILLLKNITVFKVILKLTKVKVMVFSKKKKKILGHVSEDHVWNFNIVL